ncbi:diacylglycerol kinase family protein [Pediococcus ethanolidurans]|nr:diacylglycerol kinase family protein [Pediococcus ethanolidurans]GEN94990.1 UDP kinase [Pediococcus ethanolidurans]
MLMALKDKKQTEKNHTFSQSFVHAYNGLIRVFHEERNMRIHSALAIIVIVFAWILHLTNEEWYWIIACIGLMFVTETLNTVAENLVDLVTEKTYSELGKHIKDMAAGAVLIAAFFSGIIGLCIFVPKIWMLLVH